MFYFTCDRSFTGALPPLPELPLHSYSLLDGDRLCPPYRQTLSNTCYYVAAKATYIRLLLGQNGGFSALAP